MFISSGFLQQRGVVGDDVMIVAQHADGGGTGVEVWGSEHLAQQAVIDLIHAPGDPEGFELGMDFRLLGSPGFDGGDHFAGGMAAQLATSAIADAQFGFLQVLEQGSDGCAIDLHGLHQRAARVGDAVDAAMHVVAQRVTRVVLHVTDEDVVPVDDIKAAIRCELDVHGAEVAVFADEQILTEAGLPAGAVVFDFVLLDAEETDGVGEDDVALHFIGEVTRRDDLQAARRAHFVSGRNEIRECSASCCRRWASPRRAGPSSC